jgi:hypothetical protein
MDGDALHHADRTAEADLQATTPATHGGGCAVTHARGVRADPLARQRKLDELHGHGDILSSSPEEHRGTLDVRSGTAAPAKDGKASVRSFL